MARQHGIFKITGAIDSLCFYQMNGKYYVRMKSSLDRKRVLKDVAFKRTLENAALLGKASKIASRLYRMLPADMHKHSLYRELTGKAMKLLKEVKEEEVFERLSSEYLVMKKDEEAIISQELMPKPVKNIRPLSKTDRLYGFVGDETVAYEKFRHPRMIPGGRRSLFFITESKIKRDNAMGP